MNWIRENDGNSKLMDALVAICIAILVVAALAGCFGLERKDTIVLVEPGSVVEVTSEKKVDIRTVYTAPDGTKQEAIAERSIAGTVAMPKSVYRKMRESHMALTDFMNGKITEAEMRDRLQKAKAEQGSGDDQKVNVPQAEQKDRK